MKTKNNWIILAGGILLFLVLFIFLFKTIKSPTVVRPLKPLPTEITVQLTNNGFSPASVTIKSQTAVRWLNSSTDNKASVNSDNYPTNKLYPEINLGQFYKGSSLVHIFMKEGTYTYHNQFNPKDTGTIIVEK